MKTFLCLAAVVLYLLIPGNILLLIGHFRGKSDPVGRDRMYLAGIQKLFSFMLWFSGVKVTVLGRENIPDDRPVLYVSNHRSFFDIVIGYTLVRRRCGFVAKDSFEKIPLFATWMRILHCLFLDRDNPRQGMRVILDATEKVKDDISIWICPEGTRSHGDELLPFKAGSFRIALKSGAPVIPVALTHTDDILENHFPWVRSGRVTVEFGEPIETADLSREEQKALPARVQEIVAQMYQKNF